MKKKEKKDLKKDYKNKNNSKPKIQQLPQQKKQQQPNISKKQTKIRGPQQKLLQVIINQIYKL